MNPTITRRYEIDMGHMLPDHLGKCHRPHGHRYRVEATITGPVHTVGSEAGMVTDFARLTDAMDEVLDPYDHRFVVSHDDPRTNDMFDIFGDDLLIIVDPPTAENLARRWAHQLSAFGFRVVNLRVYETPNCWADWTC